MASERDGPIPAPCTIAVVPPRQWAGFVAFSTSHPSCRRGRGRYPGHLQPGGYLFGVDIRDAGWDEQAPGAISAY
jgi:hypothetical protein